MSQKPALSEKHEPLIHRINLSIVGGAEVSFTQYARYLRTLNSSDAVIVGKDVNPCFQKLLTAPLRTVSREKFKWWNGLRLPRFARTLRARNAVSHVVMGNERAVISWNKIGNLEIADFASAANLPLIHYEHGMAWSPVARDVSAFFARTTGVIANSRAAERVLALRWGWDGPTQRVYCAVNSALPVESARARVLRERPLWLGCAARLVELKGHRIALHAIKTLREKYNIDARLSIAGIGEDESNLHTETQRLGLSDFVVFNGYVANMTEFYEKIDVLVIPSLRESFGRTSIEAQSRGCPVIVAAIDGLPETLAPNAPVITSITPEWSLDEYASELGGNKDAVEHWTYCPQSDDLIPSRTLTPDQLATSVIKLTQNNSIYCDASRVGLENVHARYMIDNYGPAIDEATIRLT